MKKAELIFVLDSSSSLTQREFVLYVLGSVNTIVNTFSKKISSLRVAVVYYSSYSFVGFKLQKLARKALIRKIDKVRLLMITLTLQTIMNYCKLKHLWVLRGHSSREKVTSYKCCCNDNNVVRIGL